MVLRTSTALCLLALAPACTNRAPSTEGELNLVLTSPWEGEAASLRGNVTVQGLSNGSLRSLRANGGAEPNVRLHLPAGLYGLRLDEGFEAAGCDTLPAVPLRLQTPNPLVVIVEPGKRTTVRFAVSKQPTRPGAPLPSNCG